MPKSEPDMVQEEWDDNKKARRRVLADDKDWTPPATGTATSSGDIISAPGAGKHLLIRKILVSNSDTSNSGRIVLKDGNTGSEVFRAWLAADGGADGDYYGSKPIKLSSNTALYAALTTTTSVDYTIQYKSEDD